MAIIPSVFSSTLPLVLRRSSRHIHTPSRSPSFRLFHCFYLSALLKLPLDFLVFPYSTSRHSPPLVLWSLSRSFSLSFFLSAANSLFSLPPAVCQTPNSLSILKPSRHSPPPPSLAAAVFPQLLYQQLTPET